MGEGGVGGQGGGVKGGGGGGGVGSRENEKGGWGGGGRGGEGGGEEEGGGKGIRENGWGGRGGGGERGGSGRRGGGSGAGEGRGVGEFGIVSPGSALGRVPHGGRRRRLHLRPLASPHSGPVYAEAGFTGRLDGWTAGRMGHDIAVTVWHRRRAVPAHRALAAVVDRLQLRSVPLHRRVACPDPGARPAVWLAGGPFRLLLASPGTVC